MCRIAVRAIMNSLTCLEPLMMKEIETFHEDIITRLKDIWHDSETELL